MRRLTDLRPKTMCSSADDFGGIRKRWIQYFISVILFARHKQPIGQIGVESLVGQIAEPSTVLLRMPATLFKRRICEREKVNIWMTSSRSFLFPKRRSSCRTEVQQIIYHVIRVVLRAIKAGLRDLSVSNCHVKTLILWSACDRWPSDTRGQVRDLVSICKRLLSNFARWLTSSNYPMYFATQWNLCDETRDAPFDKFVSCFRANWRITVAMVCCDRVTVVNVSKNSIVTSSNRYSETTGLFRHCKLRCRLLSSGGVECLMRSLGNALKTRPTSSSGWCPLKSCIALRNVNQHSSKLRAIDTHLLVYFVQFVFWEILSALQLGRICDELMDSMTTLRCLRPDVYRGTLMANWFREAGTTQTDISADCLIFQLLVQSIVELLAEFRWKVSNDFNSVIAVRYRRLSSDMCVKYGCYKRVFELRDNDVRNLLQRRIGIFQRKLILIYCTAICSVLKICVCSMSQWPLPNEILSEAGDIAWVRMPLAVMNPDVSVMKYYVYCWLGLSWCTPRKKLTEIYIFNNQIVLSLVYLSLSIPVIVVPFCRFEFSGVKFWLYL